MNALKNISESLRRPHAFGLVITVWVGLGLTACGGGDDATATTDTSTNATSTADVLCNYVTSAFNGSASVNATATAAWSCSSTLRSLTANGLPDHAVGTFPNNDNPNTIAAHVMRPEWRKLFTMIGVPRVRRSAAPREIVGVSFVAAAGQHTMSYLLMETGMFEALANGCLLQVCVRVRLCPRRASFPSQAATCAVLQIAGTPLSSLVMTLRRSSAHGPLVADLIAQRALLPATAHLGRVGLYYASSFSRHAGLPTSHILNVRASVKGARPTHRQRANAFVCSVFKLKTVGSCARLSAAMPVFTQLVKRHDTCPYGRLLALHCPLAPREASQEPTTDVLAHRLTYGHVYGFVRAVLLAVVPNVLWGDAESKRQLLRRVHWFIKQGRGDTVTVQDVSLVWKSCVATLGVYVCMYASGYVHARM